ncbi:thioesterase family protein [Nocardioides plantarum]|uniref:Thioesterase family protein n=1 Tax=Nocardioides plantarum TaxID=29299 RepID=A0ABV5KDT4_9ACTN|nr:hotdog domain-containing protein [Nocardioides plantarum]
MTAPVRQAPPVARARPVPPLARTASLARVVETGHLATAWANDLPVLATPVLLWWAELAAIAAIAPDVGPEVAPGWMSVGAAHDVRHLAPTRLGATVRVSATLVEVEGASLTFEVAAHDGDRPVLSGTHVRGIVDRERFRAAHDLV